MIYPSDMKIFLLPILSDNNPMKKVVKVAAKALKMVMRVTESVLPVCEKTHMLM